MKPNRFRHQGGLEVASNGIVDALLEFPQIARLGRDAAIARRFVPKSDELPGVWTALDDKDDLIHTSTVSRPVSCDLQIGPLLIASRIKGHPSLEEAPPRSVL